MTPHLLLTDAELASFVADPAYSAPSPEADWRPLPSCAEVLAHNARTGGDCFGPWLVVDDLGDAASDVRVVMLFVACLDAGDAGDAVTLWDNGDDPATNPAARYRPITRRGEALPWPEVPR